jgi:hypothetical protein
MWCFAISFWFVSPSTPCRSANIFSNPPGVTPTSNTPGSVPMFWNVCAVLGGMKTKAPAGALTIRSPSFDKRWLTSDCEYHDVLRGEFGLNISDQEIDQCVAVMKAKGTGDAPHPFFA